MFGTSLANNLINVPQNYQLCKFILPNYLARIEFLGRLGMEEEED